MITVDPTVNRPGNLASPGKTNNRNFDNNSYAIIKKQLNKSPKMANYIKEVYDAGKY